MTGSGNDFVFVDGRVAPVESWNAAQIRAACERRHGIGADGFGILEPGSEPDHVRFHFFNSDGGRAPMCGNGALCATRMARWLELAAQDEMVLETDAGLVRTRVLPGNDDLAEFELAAIGEMTEPDIEPAAGEHSMTFVTVAVPHLVVVVDDADSVPIKKRGRDLRHHPALSPDGANVNFVSRAGDVLRVRTYERGVEGETLACATGSVACAAVLAKQQKAKIPQDILTTSGRTLTAFGHLDANLHLQSPRLRGEARLVFRAILGG
ncbi:diaminopimelate epimerase [Gemmatimonadota bacterium]